MLRNAWLVPAGLILAVAASYWNALHGAFQFDDYNVIVDYGKVHDWTSWYQDLGHGIRPLLKFTYTLNWVSGLDALGFHLFNIGLHFITALLVYALAARLFAHGFGNDLRRARWAALFAALLFAVHPANTEAITYISGRSMSLMTMFYLAALLAYVKGGEESRKAWLYGASPLLFVLAVASKETAITLPFALLLWEVCRTPKASLKSILRKQAVHWGVFLALALVLLFHERYRKLMAFSAGLHSMQENGLTQLHALTYLLGQMLLPWRMNIDPDLPAIAAWAQIWPDALVWALLLIVAVLNLRKRPWLSFGLGWFVLQLFPLNVFLPRLDVMNDRHLYLAGLGVLLPVAAMVAQAHGKRNAVAAILLLMLASLTVMRNEVYRSEVALWEDTVRYSPHKARPYNNLGYAYFLEKRYSEAEQAYLTAIKLQPGYWLAENNLARLNGIAAREESMRE
jgi:tetratricopeptide (TPR) repeat protein